MRSIWSGSISFGLVNIPIKMYSAYESGSEITFYMLHENDLSPIRYVRFCKEEEKEVPFSEISKGVKIGEENYIEVNEADFARALPERTNIIQIMNFCDISDIDPIYFVRPFYLESERKSDNAYELLRVALKDTGKVGIAKMVIRTKEILAMIVPLDAYLILIQLRYENEIADLNSLRVSLGGTFSEQELNLAKRLIGQLSEPFNPHSYQETFTQEMNQIITDKIKGKRIEAKEKVRAATPPKNLEQALLESFRTRR